jgi:hypothetical protein
LAVQAFDNGISAFLRAAILVPLLVGFGVVLVPPSWSSQQASVWPHQPASSWPQEGSTVEYDLHSSFTTPDAAYHQETTARLALVYDGAAWSGSCEGQTTEVIDGTATTSDWSSPSGGKPAVAPTDAQRGDLVIVALLDDPAIADGCRLRAETVEVVARQNDVTKGEEPAETSPYLDLSITWDGDSGLVRDWSRVVHGGSSTGRLVTTDASDR